MGTATISADTSLATYSLFRRGDSKITWAAPDGVTYELDMSSAQPGQWLLVNDADGKPVMGLNKATSGQDAELVVSLAGAPSLAATLLHSDDDVPRKYYCATDGGNNNVLKRWAFRLRCEGLNESPLAKWASFQILSVRVG